MFSKCEFVYSAVFLILISAVHSATIIQTSSERADQNWWKHAAFYQIYPVSFKDSNNDGQGDLRGIISKLDHLKDAGITAAWLSPIYKSPNVDQGYDISDFKEIDEVYGDFQDFNEMVQKAHQLGIKIIMDFVPNHSSNQHDWFDKSKKRVEGYEDFYVWAGDDPDKLPNNWISRFNGPAWSYDHDRNQWYLHHFTPEQPDLNYRSKALVDNMTDILKFWLDKGVDGFRMDAVPFLFEDKDLTNEPLSNLPNVLQDDYFYLIHNLTNDLPETFDMIYQWREFLDNYAKDVNGDARIMMTEVYTDIKNTMLYYGDENRDGAHFTFNFQLITKLDKQSTARDTVAAIQEWLAYMPPQYTANWVIGNHDNHRVATRFGSERVDGMNILVALLPGVMVTYNGEEIGQENGEVTLEQGKDPSALKDPENFDKLSRDFERTPFHWDDSINAGFNEGAKTWLPVSKKYKDNNLKHQSALGLKSHYHVYQDLLKLRQKPAFISGLLKISALSDNVLAFTRETPNDESYVVVINIGSQEEIVDISNFQTLKKNVRVVLANTNSKNHDRVLPSNHLALAAYESLVARILPDVETGDSDWWKHAVFYQIYPRSFKDDTNDGVGDLKGIISKLGHLKDSGITATWLSPIYKSPQVDQGYDISDFMDIHEEYGTLEDFDNLLKAAHDLGIKVIMDFVPNHSSNEHEWFKKSELRELGYEDFYVWRNPSTDGGAPNNWLSSFKYSAWEYSAKRQQYYLHQFATAQPDLNYRNSVLVQNMKDVLKFWMDRGVDGFRMDAVPHLFEDEEFRDEPLSNLPNVSEDEHSYLNHIYTVDQSGTFDMIYQWRTYLDDYTTEHGGDARIMMTEAYTDIKNTMLYYGTSERDGAQFAFNFQLITKLNQGSNARDVLAAINEWLEHMPSQYTPNWVLGNHDNHRVATRFGQENVDGFNMLTALLPGVMVTYNGEEIGQEDGEVTWSEGKDPSACNGKEEDFDKTSRDFERTPFHWDDSINAGFNQGAKTWLPVSKKYKETNLKNQRILGLKSHYHVYQELLKLRQKPAFVDGLLKISALSDNVLAFTRETPNGDSYVVVINIGNKEEIVDLSSFQTLKKNIRVVLANTNSKNNDRVLPSNHLVLAGHESLVAKILPDVQAGDADWWKHSVFYQIYPRSFKDDTNDGVGDLKGIISKLGHLKDAGVTATWLSPIYKSPQVDQGYDISDFTDIHEEYGTLEDFDNLLKAAHDLGIKVIMDFVPNHSSNEHDWFNKSELREAGYEDFYVWRNPSTDGGPPNNWRSIFKYSAWEYNAKRQQYYLHQFAIAQPDLNYRNPVLVQNMKDVLKFWLDRGVDGFRMDAVPYLFEDEDFRDEPLSNLPNVTEDEHAYLNHIYTSDHSGTFDMIYQWRTYLDDYTTEHGGDARIMMTEAYTDIENTMLYYGTSERSGAQFTFNFQLITKLNQASNARDVLAAINEWLEHMPSQYTPNWVLGNHDNHRVATRFGPENVDGFNMLTALLPGIMVTYNGEEIGQEDGEVTWLEGQDPSACNGKEEDFDKTSRDFERTPFHWDDSVNAGFNTGYKPWLPVSAKYKTTNLKAQSADNVASHYQIYKKLLKLRQEPALLNGSLKIEAISDNVLGYTRTLAEHPTYVFLFNIGSKTENFTLKAIFPDTTPYLKLVISNTASPKPSGELISAEAVSLGAHESIIAMTTTEKPSSSSTTTTTTGQPTTEGTSTTTEGPAATATFTLATLFIGLLSILFLR